MSTTSLEKKIAAALADEGIASSNLAALITETEAAIVPPMKPPRRSARRHSIRRVALTRMQRARR